MIDSVRLSADIFLDDELFDWSVWQRHTYRNGTRNYFTRQNKVWIRYYPDNCHLIIDGKLFTMLYDTDVLNVDDHYGNNLESFLTDINNIINTLFTHPVLDIRSFRATRLDYCFNVKTPYVSTYIDLLNHAFHMANSGSKVNHIHEKHLTGSVYIKTKHDYDHNERRNYVLNYYDKSDWLKKRRKSRHRTHPMDSQFAKDVLRLEVQCGYQFIKQICIKFGLSNRFDRLLSYDIALWAHETIYNRIFTGCSDADFYTYASAKKRLSSQRAKETLLASSIGKRITAPEYAYGRKLIRNAGIFPFCFLDRNSVPPMLPSPLKLLREKCKQARRLGD